MLQNDVVLFEGDTEYGHYQVVDTIYEGRPGRVLYSGARQAAQSGIPLDDNSELLFDYNQRFFELVTSLRPKQLLLIGGGTYSLPMALVDALPDIQIDVVELDPGMDEIAAKYFNFSPSPRIKIIHNDGRRYLENSREAYDMIIVDAFEHITIPPSLASLEAVKLFEQHLKSGGVVAVNVIAAYKGLNTATIRRLLAAFQSVFKVVEIFPAGKGYTLWLPQNLVLAAQNKKLPLGQFLRYEALELLTVSPAEALSEEA
jgi:spermidine synthase